MSGLDSRFFKNIANVISVFAGAKGIGIDASGNDGLFPLNAATIAAILGYTPGDASATSGAFLRIAAITDHATTTYTTGAHTTKALVFISGGAGGGGGVQVSSSSAASGAGGGEGGTAIKLLAVAPSTAYAVAIGSGGLAGSSSSGSNGGNGGSSHIIVGATTLAVSGGFGGSGMNAGTTGNISAPGLAGGLVSGSPEISSTGGGGQLGIILSGTVGHNGLGGVNFLGGNGGDGGLALNGSLISDPTAGATGRILVLEFV
jgi:hypothetical protein